MQLLLINKNRKTKILRKITKETNIFYYDYYSHDKPSKHQSQDIFQKNRFVEKNLTIRLNWGR